MARNSHIDLVNAALREIQFDTSEIAGDLRSAFLRTRAILPVDGMPDAETQSVLKVAMRLVVKAGAK